LSSGVYCASACLRVRRFSLHDALPISPCTSPERAGVDPAGLQVVGVLAASVVVERSAHTQKRLGDQGLGHREVNLEANMLLVDADRKSTRLNSSHVKISYAVFCLKKKK